MSVPASLPTSVAAVFEPSGSVTVMSSSRRIVCSAVTTIPGFQNAPLDANWGRAWTARAVRPARSTTAASAFDKAANWSAI